jgi:hypothetical protein
MRKKRQEFMDLKQGGRSVHDYTKLFNHLAQYALDQVDTDNKKKDCFSIGLSTQLQERMVLNTGGTFPEYVSIVIIVDDAIRAHKEAKKRKGVAAPSGSAPPRYWTVSTSAPVAPALAPASTAVVGSQPTSVPAPTGSTQGSTSTTTSVVLACATDR